MKRKAGVLLYRSKNDNIEVLLVRNGRGLWSIPKGGLKVGESRIRAACRELTEETSLIPPSTLKYLGSVTNRKKDTRLTCFIGRSEGKKEPSSSSEIQEAKFFTLDEAAELISREQLPLLDALRTTLAFCA
jgi:predicted NUDIX family NTP pyrophosphohydrolase